MESQQISSPTARRCCRGKVKLSASISSPWGGAAGGGGVTAAVKKLYDHQCKDQYHAHREIKLAYQDNLDEIIERIIADLYNGTLKAGDVDPELYGLTAAELFGAIEKGYGVTLEAATGPSLEMLKRLRDNVYVFSGFKNYQMLREATYLLTDGNGTLRSFSAFKAEILKLNETYNVNFLKAEYNHAVAGAQMASNWQDYQDNADTLPLLQYITAGDGRVRPAHAGLDKVTLPVDHPFWDTYLPPNDWGCRCSVRQIAEGETTRADKLQNVPQLKDMFKINSGKDGVVFPKTHPYYEVAPEHKDQADNNFGMSSPGGGAEGGGGNG